MYCNGTSKSNKSTEKVKSPTESNHLGLMELRGVNPTGECNILVRLEERVEITHWLKCSGPNHVLLSPVRVFCHNNSKFDRDFD